MNVRTVKVILWGTPIGYLHQMDNGLIGFQYDEEYISSDIEVSPLRMPLSERIYSFPSLPEETFKGLPGMVAERAEIKKADALLFEEQVSDAVSKWAVFADEAELSEERTTKIQEQID